MKYVARDIKQFGTILGIYAHPDDECWTAGGILAAACANGQKVVCVTATRGDAGQTADEAKWPQAKLGTVREHELEDSLACLGAIDHSWLDYGDGTLADVPEDEAVERLAGIISNVQPDTILTFGPDGLTGHADHKTVSKWAALALKRAGRPATILQVRETAEKYATCGKVLHRVANIYFATLQPVTIPAAEAAVYFELPDDLYKKKVASLVAHHSQMDGIFADPAGKQAMLAYARTEAFVRAE